ncbi:hypothetical protein [Haloarchaeobius sp. TZWWS8]|uniref:hypothetical protein n=1 Tax=Haloarchaeobius sp. TZWWS8 TaxID=3446121 RepID=UPI003EBC19F8
MRESTLSATEVEALHRAELGLEWLRRAHGHLIEFHHAIGHGMDHLDVVEGLLRESGHAELADELRTVHLPRGVIDGHREQARVQDDRWSYDVLETFEEGLLADVIDFEGRTRRELADGARHVAERRQEREWRARARATDAAGRDDSADRKTDLDI